MKIHKMTKWDAGQDLIACADYLGVKEENLKKGGYLELAKEVRKYRLAIGTLFNELDSHKFGLPDDNKGSE